jgi:hypothetical protein
MKSISLHFIVAIFLSCNSVSHASENANNRIWIDVEVVTNAYEIIRNVREVVAIGAGEKIPQDDSRLPAACQAVRAAYRNWFVSCTAIYMENSQALYVVQISRSAPEKVKLPACTSPKKTAEFFALKRLIEQDLQEAFQAPEAMAIREFINTNEILDYPEATMHSRSIKYHDLASKIDMQIEDMFSSCDPTDRKSSVTMMNFIGDARRALSLAIRGIDDEDVGVRNASLRLISSFGEFVSPYQNNHIAESACRSIGKENFFDRNKGLLALLAILKRTPAIALAIDPSCSQNIRNIARWSKSDQIGTPARFITSIITHENSKI